MTFDELLNKDLTPADRDALGKLKSSGDWNTLKNFTEDHILRWAYNLLVDDFVSDEEMLNSLKSARGFVKGYRTIKRIIENK